MEFYNIQSLFQNTIKNNFKIHELSKEEKDIFVAKLKLKINNKNEQYEKMIITEQLKNILLLLKNNDENIVSVVEKTESYNILENISKEDNKNLYYIINKYKTELTLLLNNIQNYEKSIKEVFIYIQYVLELNSDMNTQHIKKMITQIKNISDIVKNNNEIINTDEYNNVQLQEMLNTFYEKMNFNTITSEDKVRLVTYINYGELQTLLFDIIKFSCKNTLKLDELFFNLFDFSGEKQLTKSYNIIERVIYVVDNTKSLNNEQKKYFMQLFLNYIIDTEKISSLKSGDIRYIVSKLEKLLAGMP